MSTKYICENPACEDYYEVTLIELSDDQIVSGGTSETCCPKCGFNLTPLDYYLEEKKKLKKIKSKKLIKLVIYSTLGIIIISCLIFLLTSKRKTEPSTIKTSPTAIGTAKSAGSSNAVKETITQTQSSTSGANQLKTKKAETTKSIITPKGNLTKNFPKGSKYVGEMKNGQMEGLGTFYYGQRELISPRDIKKRFADAGDYLIGEWYEGYVSSGKLYDKNNNLKEVIIIGH